MTDPMLATLRDENRYLRLRLSEEQQHVQLLAELLSDANRTLQAHGLHPATPAFTTTPTTETPAHDCPF